MIAPVVVAVVPASSDGTTAAIRWAAREAVRARRPLQILLPAGGDPAARRSALVHALAVARRAARSILVSTSIDDELPERAVRIASADAALVVVAGGTGTDPALVDDLLLDVQCPLVVVPPGADCEADGPVLLAAGPATPSTAIVFAFAEAEVRRVAVVAVRTWHDPLVDLGVPVGSRVARWDAGDATQRDDLADQLALAHLAHPGVALSTRVVDDGCADVLVALSLRAGLLVLGRPTRGSLLSRVLPSPATTLARLAPCPVAVVPPDGPVRRTLLPRRRGSRVDQHG